MSKVRAEQYTNRLGTGAPEIPYGVTVPEGASIDGAGGLNLTGIATAGTFKGDLNGNVTGVTATFTGPVTIGGTLTYEDVTNIDAVGVITARDGIRVGAGKSIGSDGAAVVYYGNGANLTDLPASGGTALGVAGLNIANGATVAVASSDGKFYPVTGANEAYGSPVEALTSATPIMVPNIAYDTANNKVIVAMQGHSDDDGRVAVGTVSGTTISWGTTVKYNGTTNARPTSVCYDSTNEKVVVVFREDSGQLWSIVGTVSGTSISFGTKVSVDTNTNYWPACAFDSTTGKVIITYRRQSTDYGAARVGTVSGNSISWGSEVLWTNVQITQSEVVCHDGYCVAVSDDHITVGQISGTSITFGTMQAVPFTDGNANTDETNIAVDPNTGTFMVGGMRDSTDKFVEVFAATRSGTTLTFGAGVVLKQNQSKNTTCCWSGNTNSFFWSFDSGTSGADGLQSCIVEVTGTTSVAKTPRVWYAPSGNDQSQGQSCVYDPDTQSVVVFFQNAAVSNNAWYYIERNRISNGTRGGFVGISDAAYTAGQTATITVTGAVSTNQTGLSTASAYYLQGNGSLATAPDSENLLVGNALSATNLLLR